MSLAWLLVVLPALVLFMTVVNVVTWPRGREEEMPNGSISVLIPARNEEHNIERTLRSVLATADNERIAEILVYDDRSTDATGMLVDTFTARDDRVRLLRGTPLPPGWVGKPHACANLANEATGEVLFFMDADVSLSSKGLQRLRSIMQDGAELVSAVPRQITETWTEKLVIPMLLLTYTSWLPLVAAGWGRRTSTVAANGQLLMLRRDVYDSIGGFESVRNEIVDDVAFCRRAKSLGHRFCFADGTEVATCRMYRGGPETIAGFSKNLHEGVGGSFALLSIVLLYLATFLLPFAALSLSPLFVELSTPSLTASALLLLQRILLAWRHRQHPSAVFLHPASILAFAYIALRSWQWSQRGSIEWAGRSYSPRSKRVSREAEVA